MVNIKVFIGYTQNGLVVPLIFLVPNDVKIFTKVFIWKWLGAVGMGHNQQFFRVTGEGPQGKVIGLMAMGIPFVVIEGARVPVFGCIKGYIQFC